MELALSKCSTNEIFDFKPLYEEDFIELVKVNRFQTSVQ